MVLLADRNNRNNWNIDSETIEDHTAPLGLEKVERNAIIIETYSQCPSCRGYFGVPGIKSALVNVITALGIDTWCQECYEEGLNKGTCLKLKKLNKKEKKRLRRERRS